MKTTIAKRCWKKNHKMRGYFSWENEASTTSARHQKHRAKKFPAITMAAFSASLPPSTTHPPSNKSSLLLLHSKTTNFISSPSFPNPRTIFHYHDSHRLVELSVNSYRITTRGGFTDEEDEEEDEICSFDEAVSLFNKRDYYKCHDVLEALWNNSQDPTRTLVHGILQCAVGFHHLFNQVCYFMKKNLIFLKEKWVNGMIHAEPQGSNDGTGRRAMQVEKNELRKGAVSSIWERYFCSTGIHLPHSAWTSCLSVSYILH